MKLILLYLTIFLFSCSSQSKEVKQLRAENEQLKISLDSIINSRISGGLVIEPLHAFIDCQSNKINLGDTFRSKICMVSSDYDNLIIEVLKDEKYIKANAKYYEIPQDTGIQTIKGRIFRNQYSDKPYYFQAEYLVKK